MLNVITKISWGGDGTEAVKTIDDKELPPLKDLVPRTYFFVIGYYLGNASVQNFGLLFNLWGALSTTPYYWT